jgi:transposase
MERILVGIDLSRKYYDVSCLDPGGEVLLAHRRFAHTPAGTRQLRQTVGDLVDQHGYAGAEVAAESTGLLWFHLMYHLAQHEADYSLYLLNPRELRQFRKAMAQEDKTDPKDAHLIADRQRFRRPKHQLNIDMRYLPLQRLTRYRYALVKQLAGEKVRLSNLVYLKASAYSTVRPLGDIFSATSQQVLSDDRSLGELAALPTDELARLLQKNGRRRFAHPERNAAKLKQVVGDSFPLPDELAHAVATVLELGLEHVRSLDRIIAQLDKAIATEAGELPGYHILRSIPGIGPVFAAGLLAEIGDVGRFLHGTALDRRGRPRPKSRRDAEAGLAKMAGLFWPRNASGDFDGQDRPLSKRGNVYLRYYLVQAANSIRLHDPTYAAYYARKYREAVRHHHRRAIVLTARKVVRLIFAMLQDGQQYRPRHKMRSAAH